jgi:peptidoglycan-associated lipoprotein
MKSFISCALAILMTLVVFGCKKAPPETVAVSDGPIAPIVAPAAQAPVPESVKQMAANFSKVFFEFDAATLTNSAQQALSDNVAIMADNSDVKVEIQGHADERGTTDYNLSLGQQRAESVKKYMVAQGISPTRLATISYGEERPVDGSSSEVAWSKNRRAEFRITWGEGSVTGTTH